MTLSLTKRVNYEPSERLDLNDKLAEDTLLDETLGQHYQGLISQSPDGRIFKGWTTTTSYPETNTGFNIPSEEGFAIDRAGNVLIRDGASGFLVPLASDSVNYIYAHYEEETSDTDQRRKYELGAEAAVTLDTRVTRTTEIHTTTTPYGAIDFVNFAKTALISGTTRELIPLYAVVVDNLNEIELIEDWRPMWAPGIEAATPNKYQSEEADFPHSFVISDAPTISITDVRTALVAITDRLKQLKGTTTWWEDNDQSLESVSNEWTRSGGNIYRTGGFVGIGVDPVATLHLESGSPTIRVRDTDGASDRYLQVAAGATVASVIYTGGASGNASLYLDTQSTGSGNCSIFFFRTCATTGDKVVRFSRGNSNDNSARIGVDGLDSYFQIHGGNLGIGVTSPAYTVDVNPPSGAATLGVAPQTAGEGSSIELGTAGSGNRPVWIDFTGDDVNTYGLRIIRESSGQNARSVLFHQGTGDFVLDALDDTSVIKLQFPTNQFTFQEDNNGNPILTIGDTTEGAEQPELRLIGSSHYFNGGLRLYRGNTGENAPSYLVHRGTGDLILDTSESGDIRFNIGSVGFHFEDRFSTDKLANRTDRILRITQFAGNAQLDFTTAHIETTSTLKLLGSADNLVIGSADVWTFEEVGSDPTIKFDANKWLQYDSFSATFEFLGGTAGADQILSINDVGVTSQVQLSMTSNKIINVADPTNDQDAATKAFVAAHTEIVRFTDNLIFNSNFDIYTWNWKDELPYKPFQRFALHHYDHWRFFYANNVGGLSGNRGISTVAVENNNAVRISREAGSTGTSAEDMYVGQEIRWRLERLQGKKLTLTFRARRGTGYSATSNALRVRVNAGTGDVVGAVRNGSQSNPGQYTVGNTNVLDTTVTLGTAAADFTVDVPALPSSFTQLSLYFVYKSQSAGGPIPANDYCDIWEIMLVEGDVSIPWERRGVSYDGEFQLSKAYSEASWGNSIGRTTFPTEATYVTYNHLANHPVNSILQFGYHPTFSVAKWVDPSDYTFKVYELTNASSALKIGGVQEGGIDTTNETRQGVVLFTVTSQNFWAVDVVEGHWVCYAFPNSSTI